MPADTTPPDAAIALRDVTKRFDRFTAVDGVTLNIQRGEVFGLIGHNGAGKSTLFKMMLGLLAPTSGSLLVDGAPVHGAAARDVRRGIGYLPENVALWDNLSGLETLRFFARLKRVDTSGCAALLERVGLGSAGSKPVRAYSKGMRQRLGFAQALLGKPRVLFLDEPTNGLDPQAIRDFYATLRGLQQQGVTVIITSHILAELQERVDRLAILVSGKVEALGSVHELRERTGLPLIIEVDLAPQDCHDALHVLHQVTGVKPAQTPSGLQLQCPREHKMAALAALTPLGARVQDLRLHEPSLEDMFFGISA